MIKITIREQTFLDLSKGWFLVINGLDAGGECSNPQEVINCARELYNNLCIGNIESSLDIDNAMRKYEEDINI